MSSAPILDNKDPGALSVFEPTALLREARRQKGLPIAKVPALCILDPDGDLVRRLRNSGQASSRRTGLVITPISTNFRLPVNPPLSLGAPLGHLLPFWWLKNSLLAAVACWSV